MRSSRRDGRGEQSVDRQPARPVERDVARDVAAGDRRAQVGALHRALLGDQADRRDAERLRRMRQADRHRGAAATSGGVGLLEHRLAADGLEGVVAHRPRSPPEPARPRPCRGHRWRGSRRVSRQFQLRRYDVHRDNRMRTDERAPRSADKPTPPSPKTTALRPARTLGRVHDRTDAGHHRTAEQRCDLRRQGRVDLHRRPRRHHRMVGEPGHPEMVMHPVSSRSPSAGSPSPRAVCRPCWRRPRLTQRGPALRARTALAAGRDEGEHDRVTGREPGSAGLDHLACRLVAEQHRHHARPRAVDHRQVGVAQAGRADPDQQLAGPGRLPARPLRSAVAATRRTGRAGPSPAVRRRARSSRDPFQGPRLRSGTAPGDGPPGRRTRARTVRSRPAGLSPRGTARSRSARSSCPAARPAAPHRPCPGIERLLERALRLHAQPDHRAAWMSSPPARIRKSLITVSKKL